MAKGGVNRWNETFKIACEHEASIFDTGMQHPTPYEIVGNGIYFIQNFSTTKRVLVNQNVEISPSDTGSSVVGVNKTGEENEKVMGDALVLVCPQTNPLYSGMSSQPKTDIRSETRGLIVILELPLNQIEKKAELRKLLTNRTIGGLILFRIEANQAEDRNFTSMSSCEAWHGTCKTDMGLLRIHESKNLQYTLNADHEDRSTNFKSDHTLV